MKSKRIWCSPVSAMLLRKEPELSAGDAAAGIAVRLRRKHNLRGNIEPEEVAKLFGARVVYNSLTTDAFLRETEQEYVIEVNRSTSPTRRRFSIAHEIGHLALYQATGSLTAFGSMSANERQDSETREVEDLCDRFAVELLMPADEWVDRIFSDGISLYTFSQLRREYGVSLEASLRRVADPDVAMGSYAIILWSRSEVGLEVKRFWHTESFGRTPWPDPLKRVDDIEDHGSPVRALRLQRCTAGDLDLAFGGEKRRCLVQSSSIGRSTNDAVSLVLAGDPQKYLNIIGTAKQRKRPSQEPLPFDTEAATS